MARVGRPPKGIQHVETLDGPDEAKRRLRVILETIQGDLSVSDAAEQLGLSEPRFHVLRQNALTGAIEALSPGVRGRPRKAPADEEEIARLREQVAELEVDAEVARLRTEIALLMPHLLREPAEKKRDTGVCFWNRGAVEDAD